MYYILWSTVRNFSSVFYKTVSQKSYCIVGLQILARLASTDSTLMSSKVINVPAMDFLLLSKYFLLLFHRFVLLLPGFGSYPGVHYWVPRSSREDRGGELFPWCNLQRVLFSRWLETARRSTLWQARTLAIDQCFQEHDTRMEDDVISVNCVCRLIFFFNFWAGNFVLKKLVIYVQNYTIITHHTICVIGQTTADENYEAPFGKK